MAERTNAGRGKTADVDETRKRANKDSEALSKSFMPEDAAALRLNETPLVTSMENHAAALSVASPAQRAIIARHLQQTYGNRYVQRVIRSISVQAKLTVSQPGDPYEQEADRVAEAATRSNIHSVSLRTQREPEEEEELHSKAELGRLPEKEEDLQTKNELRRQPGKDEEDEMLEANGDAAVPEVTQDIEKRIQSEKGGGQPLPDLVRATLEPSFGHDFSHVRVHTDTEADELSSQLSAKAFTTGQDIFFRGGEYQPDSGEGQKLIAHELTHVVQQCAARAVQRDETESPAANSPAPEARPPATQGQQDRLLALFREVWMPLNTASGILMGRGPQHERAEAARASLRAADTAALNMIPQFSGNEQAGLHLMHLSGQIELAETNLRAFVANRLSIQEIQSLVDPNSSSLVARDIEALSQEILR